MLIKANNQIKLTGRVQYDSQIKKFTEYLQGKEFSEITLREYFQSMKENDLSPSTQRLAKVALKKAIRQALPAGYEVDEKLNSVFKSIKLDKPQVRVSGDKVIDKKLLLKFLNNSPERISLISKFLYNSGCRISEALSVKLSQCKADGKAVYIKIIGKGGKQETLTVSLDLFEKIKTVFKSEKYLFQSPLSKSGKYHRVYVSGEIAFYSHKLTGKRISAHDLRHSRATHLIGEGNPIEAVSKFLRHSDIGTTLRIYSHNI